MHHSVDQRLKPSPAKFVANLACEDERECLALSEALGNRHQIPAVRGAQPAHILRQDVSERAFVRPFHGR